MKIFRIFLLLSVFFLSCLSLPTASLASNQNSALDKTLSGLNEAVKGEGSQGGIGAYKSQLNQNPQDYLTDRVADLIYLLLSFLGIIFLILTIYAGFLWMTAQGNDSKTAEAKKILINAIIGLIVITAAYALTAFVGTELTK